MSDPSSTDYLICNRCGYFVGKCLCHKGIDGVCYFDDETGRPNYYFKLPCKLCRQRTWHFKNIFTYEFTCIEHSFADENDKNLAAMEINKKLLQYKATQMNGDLIINRNGFYEIKRKTIIY